MGGIKRQVDHPNRQYTFVPSHMKKPPEGGFGIA